MSIENNNNNNNNNNSPFTPLSDPDYDRSYNKRAATTLRKRLEKQLGSDKLQEMVKKQEDLRAATTGKRTEEHPFPEAEEWADTLEVVREQGLMKIKEENEKEKEKMMNIYPLKHTDINPEPAKLKDCSN